MSRKLTVAVLARACCSVSKLVDKMPGVSPLQAAKRALVKVLLALASAYNVSVQVTRDSADSAVNAAYKKLALKVHPDKGGTTEHFQQLQDAKEKWDTARQNSATRGAAASDVVVSGQDDRNTAENGHRVQCKAVLLTYFGAWSQDLWQEFLQYVRGKLAGWSVWRWCATLERSEAGNLHVHLQLQFRKVLHRTAQFFAWKGRRPNATANNYLGEGVHRGGCYQQSVDRAFFYVFADKEGTQKDSEGNLCVDGNYFPAWVKGAKAEWVKGPVVGRYEVRGKWPESLWKQHKLSHAKWDEYLFLCRDGVVGRKRNLDAVRQREEEDEEDLEREATAKRIRENTFTAFAEIPEVTAWLALFAEEVDRYPFLVVLGASRTRKTEYAKSLFKAPLILEMGDLEHFPDRMREFSRKVHDAVVLDDVRDFAFLVRHQEKLQGKSETKVEFASTPGGKCAYCKWLHRVPLVVTANFSTKNRHLLEEDDFLGHADNRVVVERAAP